MSAQLPLLIRGMFFERWQPAHTPVHDRALDHFVAAIAANIGDVRDWRGAEDIEIVMRLLNGKISEGEIADIKAGLPMAIRDLWPD